jgi:L-asparaginase
MQSTPATVVILGTGGTIAGTSPNPADNIGYSAAQLGVAQLVAAVPALAQQDIECEQVAQLDSKDMDFGVWLKLAQRIERHLARPEVTGIVVTHGTDTLEETAYFLQRVLAPARPVVLTAAMRPATSLQADGPQNLFDAVCVARSQAARGVVAMIAGRVHSALDVRKVHTYRLDAFDSGDAGPLAVVEEGKLRSYRAWPKGAPFGLARLPAALADWPRVEIVTSGAGVGASMVSALRACGARGIVTAGTGNGALHRELEAALVAAQSDGLAVLRSTRCGDGAVHARADDALPSAGALTPVQARIELILDLIAANFSAPTRQAG